MIYMIKYIKIHYNILKLYFLLYNVSNLVDIFRISQFYRIVLKLKYLYFIINYFYH